MRGKERIVLFEGSQVSASRPDKGSSVKVKMLACLEVAAWDRGPGLWNFWINIELYTLESGKKNNLLVLRAIKLNFDKLQSEGLQE
jgi:hypothetical protein